jgi:hypothetical protein
MMAAEESVALRADAHMCPYNGRNYAHLVIRGDG